MAYPVSVLPDAELALIQYLRAAPEVTALVPGTRIYTAVPASAVYPLVVIQRAGGVPLAWQHVDVAAIQVDVVGGSRFECSLLARTVHASIVAIRNDTVEAATLSSAAVEVGLQWLPDVLEATVTPFPRYTSRYSIILHN